MAAAHASWVAARQLSITVPALARKPIPTAMDSGIVHVPENGNSQVRIVQARQLRITVQHRTASANQ